MKKFITVSAIALILAPSIIAQTKKTGWEIDNLKGRIKSIVTNSYDIIIEKGEIHKGNKVEMRTDIYNSIGCHIEQYEEYDDPESRTMLIFEFDSKGDRIKYTSYNPGGGRYYTVTYKYTNGKISSTETSKPVGEPESQVYLYNSKSQLIEDRVYGPDNTLKQSTTYKYDSSGNQFEEVIIDATGTLDSKYFRKFDAKGNIIEARKESYTPNGELWEARSFIFRYSRNNWGDWADFTSSEIDGKLKRKETYEYEYDEKHNWIKKVTIENDKPKKIEERAIEYFK